MIINNPTNPTTRILPSKINITTINEDILDDFSDNISYKASTALFN